MVEYWGCNLICSGVEYREYSGGGDMGCIDGVLYLICERWWIFLESYRVDVLIWRQLEILYLAKWLELWKHP